MTNKPGGLPSRPVGLLTRMYNKRVRKQFTVPVRSIEQKGKKLRVLKFSDPNEFAQFARTNPQMSGEYYDLRDADFTNANLDGADLRNADMSRVRMPGASLHHALLQGALMDRCRAEGAHFVEADLTGVKARDARLENIDLSNARIEGADFSFSRLNSAKFDKAEARKANFSNAKLNWARMTNGVFTGANLDQAETDGCWFEGSDFSLARLSNRQVQKAHKDPAQWSQVKVPATQISPDTGGAVRLRRIKKKPPQPGPGG